MQVEHKTEMGTVLFVKVPDDAIDINLSLDTILHFTSKAQNPMGMNGDYFVVDEDFKLIGPTSEVTEEQAKMMVDYSVNKNLYYDYHDKVWSFFFCDNALYSFKSLMQHLHIYEFNPIERPDKWYDLPIWDQNNEVYNLAELRTGKWIVLFKPNEK